ncbi:lactonase family protein [Streptoalloteichus tenebrarius]|nr:lactonase family protein [Streptoalloteichus tenebrarius]
MTRAYLGSYTSGDSRGGGLSLLAVDQAGGRLSDHGLLDVGPNPSFLALAPAGDVLYVVNEEAEGTVGAVRLDGGRPAVVNHQPSLGGHPCHLSAHPGGGHVFTANYSTGSVVVHPVRPDGGLAEPSDLVRHTGSGPDPDRQEGPHAHQVLADPTGRWVLAVDLGIDGVVVSAFDERAGRLRQHEVVALAPGSGPRHLAFHPDGRSAYVLGELDSTVTACSWDAERGELRPGQVVSTLPPGWAGRSYPAEIVVSADGRFCYASNRGHDSVAVFAVEERGRRLRLVGVVPTGGAWPRHIALSPAGTHLYAANERSDTVTCFRVDRDSGALLRTDAVLTAGSPVCLVFD